jgi:hypothetical protein
VVTLTVVTPLVTGITRNADGSVTLNFVGLPDSRNPNLGRHEFGRRRSSGSHLSRITSTGEDGTWQFTDTNAVNFPERFYHFSIP